MHSEHTNTKSILVGKIAWNRKWQPTPGFLPGKFHGQRSLIGYGPWGHTGSLLNTHEHDLLIAYFPSYLLNLREEEGKNNVSNTIQSASPGMVVNMVRAQFNYVEHIS